MCQNGSIWLCTSDGIIFTKGKKLFDWETLKHHPIRQTEHTMGNHGNGTLLIQENKITNLQEIKKNEIIDQVLDKNSISIESPTKTMMIWQSRIIDEGYTKSLHDEMKQKLSKQMHVNIAFGGSLGSYNDFEKFLRESNIAETKEKILAKRGKHPLFANEKEVREFYHDKTKGTKSPVMPTHYDKLGTVGEVTFEELRKKNLMAPTISRDELILLVKKERGRLLTPVMAEKYCNEINEKFVEWYSKTYLHQGKGEGVLHRIAKKEVTRYSKKNHLSYEQTNEIGEKMEIYANKIEPEVGKAVAKLAIKNDSSMEEGLMGFLEVGCKMYQVPIEQAVSFLSNRLKRNGSKKNQK